MSVRLRHWGLVSSISASQPVFYKKFFVIKIHDVLHQNTSQKQGD